jgi:hypothetical protein
MRGLISEFRSKTGNHSLRSYTEKLLAAFGAPSIHPISASSQLSVDQNLVEPLSARELESIASDRRGALQSGNCPEIVSVRGHCQGTH